jgi:shikimate dehydrogenase
VTITSDEEEVSFVSGRTKLFAIVGHPIEQVRSPEMVTAELKRRGHEAILIPIHVFPQDFANVMPNLMKVENLFGLIFTIPYKAIGMSLASEIGLQASVVGAANALSRRPEGGWRAEIFDGLGCVQGFSARGISFRGKQVMLIGAGGAGAAIGVAVAHEKPSRMRLFDLDPTRAQSLAAKIKDLDRDIQAEVGEPDVRDCDVLLNASPVGMLGDARMPISVTELPAGLVVFDAIVKPERTPLLLLAERCGCVVIYGREMMRGQIGKMVDFFEGKDGASSPGQPAKRGT